MKKQVHKADQAKIRQRKHIAFRMNFLFFSIFILFSLLIFRLGYLQIVKGEEYSRKLERTEEVAVNTSVPRGRLFDRSGTVLVDNEPKDAITYTKTTSTSAKEMHEIAKVLATLIEQDTNRITRGDKRDFWILNHPEEALAKVSKKEQLKYEKDGSLTRTEAQRAINKLTRERVTDEEINSFTDEELEVLAIYREMMSGYAYSPQIVKSGNVSKEEFAAVSERLGEPELQGVDTTSDWVRVQKSKSAILGRLSTPIEGIPDSRKEYFLARDYARNDRVGKSYIEQYYEELLRGQKTIAKNIKDRSGRVVETKTIREGEPGKDLVLSIDSELEQALEEIVSNKLLELKAGPNAQELDRAFLVMMNPNNGEVLSLVGKQVVKNQDTGKFEILDYAYGTFTSSYEAGSTVKMATLLTGYQENAARIGEFKIDEPIKIGGTLKSSVFNRGSRMSIGDIEAIGRSSNVYMFRIAIAMGKGNYRYGESMSIDKTAFETFRQSFASFGLGVKTGIDLPGESAGYVGNETKTGLLLDFAIGQYDTYSPLQLAQYVSTIANGGYRIAPKVLKEIREPSEDGEILGPLIQETDVTILNRINSTDAEIEQVKRGMYYTYHGANGTAKRIFNDFDGAGKTGTAQTSSSGRTTISLSHVGFAPFENPEIAYAVLIPHVSTTSKYPYANNEIAKAAVDKYFELKAQRAEENTADVTQPIKKPAETESDK
ncbi:peptidoglycan D,D-transpeptidase FtsI family protein [Sporosarcina sp. NPDC096371]|uniref:peptidoglycan D,D-transpeptidase FtsI family protein n=1 Tax=Sporosarcina sp. NPDC096371 TaxID=3364530 RepID=UPI003809B147